MRIQRFISAAALLGAVLSSTSQAAIPAAGWGYSVGNLVWGILPWNDEGAGWWDPAPGTILSGRLTLEFDPSFYQITTFGWFGDFGSNPAIPPPPILNDRLTVDPSWAAQWHLQSPNSGLSSNVSLDNVHGLMVVTFDWGPGGYTPAAAADFNFFGYQYTLPAGMTNAQLQAATTGDYGPGKMVLLQSLQDVASNGTAAQTYMLCSGGFCGVNPIPEPSSWAMMLASLCAVGLWARRRAR